MDEVFINSKQLYLIERVNLREYQSQILQILTNLPSFNMKLTAYTDIDDSWIPLKFYLHREHLGNGVFEIGCTLRECKVRTELRTCKGIDLSSDDIGDVVQTMLNQYRRCPCSRVFHIKNWLIDMCRTCFVKSIITIPENMKDPCTCIICYEVISFTKKLVHTTCCLPAKHTLCMKCANKLPLCPICRKPMTTVFKVLPHEKHDADYD
jgi:hypothetical protein